MDIYGGVQGVEFALVELEVRRCEVADVDGTSAVTRKLVCGGAADANDRVCA